MILLLFHMINQIEITRMLYINDTLIANLIEWIQIIIERSDICERKRYGNVYL